MPAPFFPNSRVAAQANALQTELALSVVKLFKSGLVPGVETVVADLDAAECDYTDYAPITITAWDEPIKAQGGGYQISAPTVQFSVAVDQAASNLVGGYWIELAGGAVVVIRQFDEPVLIASAFDGLQINPTIVLPTNVV